MSRGSSLFVVKWGHKRKGIFMAAITTFGTPVDYMNMRQLRHIARNSGIYYDLSTSREDLIDLINDAE